MIDNSILENILETYYDQEFLKADGFDYAIIGVEESSSRLIYSIKMIIEILVNDGMNYDDAMEYFNFNVSGSYMGEKTPIWCNDNF
jgi:hypothetical protein